VPAQADVRLCRIRQGESHTRCRGRLRAVISAAWRPACTLPASGGLRRRDRLSRHVLYERVICVIVVAFIPATVA
jgi:hypothetical protein